MSFRRAVARAVAEIPILGRIALAATRARIAAPYVARPIGLALRWLVQSRELANFTYALTELNRNYLGALLSEVTGDDFERFDEYMGELETDSAIREHVRTTTEKSRDRIFADSARIEFGRRLGWYALVRATKPSVVIETGVDKGLGSCVLCSALLRNRSEGFPGRYYGTDFNPLAGYLLHGRYAEVGTILYGDSIESLRKFDQPIDLFVNDSDHSAEYEAREYETIREKLSDHGIVLGDNSHVTDALFQFARRTHRQFLFFREAPANHWYPGAGIGLAFTRRGRPRPEASAKC